MQGLELCSLSQAGGSLAVGSNIYPRDFELMGLSKLISRLTSWTPVGKKIILRIEDSSRPDLVTTEWTGTIRSLSSDNSVIISLDKPIWTGSQDLGEIAAVTRHKGYDFYRIRFGFVAASLLKKIGADEATKEDIFALAVLKVVH